MRCPASAYAISASTCPLYAWTAFLNDKAAARWHLEVVQRIRIRHSRPIRDYEHDDGPSPPSAPSAKLRACYTLRVLSVRHFWYRGDDIATVQCRHPRRVHAHAIAGTLNSSFQDICHAEFTADLAEIARNTTLVLDHRSAADHL